MTPEPTSDRPAPPGLPLESVRWEAPPSRQELGEDEIHVWRAGLLGDQNEIRQGQRTLSADEQRRAEGFFTDKQRQSFVIARAALRTILSGYIGVEPEAIRFNYNRHGKPELAGKGEGRGLQFSVSHSHRLALLAFGRRGKLGVDVEWLQRQVPIRSLADRFFSSRELSEYDQIPEAHQSEAFFALWTRKEAYIKALGRGLSYPVRQFSVVASDSSGGRLEVVDEGGRKLDSVSIRGWRPEPGYVAALAVEGLLESVRFLRWPATLPNG